MATEDIGGVSISIGGDSSDLKEALDRAIQAAEAAGQNISEAIAKAYEGGAGNLKQALDQIGASADGLKNAAQPMADTVTQAGAALQSTGEQASTAGGKLDEFSEHAHGAGEAAHEAHGGAHELLEGLLEFAGIAVTIEALKEFVTEAVEVYAHTEKIQISLGYLSGSTKEAAEEIEKLKGFAMNLAVPFDAAAEAAQKFSASGLEFPQINEALRAAADVAAATGTSFETAAGKMDSLANSSVVGARQLKTLKITTEDLAEAMGIRTDQIKTAWAGMDVEQRMDAMTTAAQKFQGAGDALAKGTGGQLQQIKNAWHETMDSVGESIAPITSTVLPALLDGFKYVVAGVEGAIGVIKVVVDTVKGVFAEVYSAVSGFAVAVAKVTSGDMKGAVDTLGDTFKNLEIIESATSQKIQADTLQTAFQLQDLFGKTAKSAEDSGDRQAKAHAAAGAAAALAAAETKKAMEEVEKFGQSAQALLDKIPEVYGDYVSKLQDGGATASSLLKNVSSELDKAATAMTNLRGEPLRAMQEWVDELKAAQDKLRDFADSDEFRKIGDKVAGIGAKFVEIKPQILNVFNDVLGQMAQIPGAVARDGDKLITWLGEVVKAQDALDRQIQTTQKTMDTAYIKYEERTRSQTIPITVTLAERFAGVTTGAAEANKKLDEMGDNGPGKVLELVTAIGTLHLSVDGLTDREHEALQAFDKIVDSGTTSLPLIEGGWNAVSAAISKLAKENMPEAIRQQGLYVDALVRANAPHADILRAQEAMYANQVKLAQEQGKDWSAYGIELDEAKRHQQDLIDSGGTLYRLYQDSMKVTDDMFKGLSKGFADAVVDGKNLEDSLTSVFKNLAKTIVNDLMGEALTPLRKSLKDLIGGEFNALNGATQAGMSGIAGLAQASTKAAASGMEMQHSIVMATAGFGDAAEATDGIANAAKKATSSLGSLDSSLISMISAGVIAIATSAISYLAGESKAAGDSLEGLAGVLARNNFNPTPENVAAFNQSNIFGATLTQPIIDEIRKLEGLTTDGSSTAQASADQVKQAVTNLGGDIEKLKAQAAGLNQEIVIALAAGDTKTVAELQKQLGNTNSLIQADQTLLDQINKSTQGTVNALTNGSGAIPSAVKELQDAIATGDIDAIAKAAAGVQQTIGGNTDKLTVAEKAVGDAIIAGNADALSKALGELSKALTAKQDQDTKDLIATMTGPASPQQVVDALEKEQKHIDDLAAQEKQLEQDLAIAIANGNTDLAAAIEKQIGIVDGELKTGNTTLGYIQAAALDALPGLQAKLTDLSSQEREAIANGDTALADKLGGEIDATNAQITYLQGLNVEGNKNTAAIGSTLTTISTQLGTFAQQALALGIAAHSGVKPDDLSGAALQGMIDYLKQQIQDVMAQEDATTYGSPLYLHLASLLQSLQDQLDADIQLQQKQLSAPTTPTFSSTATLADMQAALKDLQAQLITDTGVFDAAKAQWLNAIAHNASSADIATLKAAMDKASGIVSADNAQLKFVQDTIAAATKTTSTNTFSASASLDDMKVALKKMQDQAVADQATLTADTNKLINAIKSNASPSDIAALKAQVAADTNKLSADNSDIKLIQGQIVAAQKGTTEAVTGVGADLVGAYLSGTASIVSSLSVGFTAISDSQVQAAQQVAAAVAASAHMGMNPVTGNIPPGTFPGETYGATGNPIAPGFYFSSGSIAQRQSESQLAQAALYAGDWNAWQYALSTFAAASGGAIPAWAETNPGTGVAYTPEDLAANAAAHHTGGSITGLHSFDTGGLITADQVAQVHAGELVLTAEATQKFANYTKQTAELEQEIANVQHRIDSELHDGNLNAAAADKITLEVLRNQLVATREAQAATKAQWMEELAKLNTQEITLQTQLATQQQQAALLTTISQILPTLQLPAGFQGGGLPIIMGPPAGGSQQVPGSPIITGPPTGGSQQVPSLPIIMGPPAGGSPGNGPVPLASAITNLEKYLENQLTTEELRKLRAQIGNESLIDYYRHTLTQAEWANIQRFVGTPGLFPSFATGIDYVPYDMTARIHEGERVLNRGEAQAYGTGPQNINITVNGANVPNPRELARMIGDHVKSVTSNNQVRR